MSDSISPFLRRVNNRDSGYAGRRAEGFAAKRMKGVSQPGSGAIPGAKGDFKVEFSTESFLVENKTVKGDSFSIRRDHLLKVYQEALEQSRLPALAFQFVTTTGASEKRDRWVSIPERVFLELLSALGDR